MENSILLSTKKVLNVSPDDPSFDMDILTFINSAFSTLHDLGVGPVGGLGRAERGPAVTRGRLRCRATFSSPAPTTRCHGSDDASSCSRDARIGGETRE